MIGRRSFLLSPLAFAAGARAQVHLPNAVRQPNVVLIIASGWRGQAVPWERDQDLVAPNLAQFAREGLTFPRTYAGYPRAVPARRILLNGAFSHGFSRLDVSLEQASLGARLKAAGYRAAAFGDHKIDEIISYVHSASTQPFYVEWTLTSGSGFIERGAVGELHLRSNVSAPSESEAREELVEFYERCTTRDHDIGVVLSALDRSELKDNTLVVFTSDRGDQLGSHGISGDDSFYEETVRIPLAMRHPQLERGGQRDMLVSQADLAPTILGFCNATISEEMQGRNLAPFLISGKGEPPDAVFAEGRVSEPEEWRMLVHGYDKVIANRTGTPTHLFNLLNDPYEMTNLVNVTAEKLKRDSMVALLQFWRKKLSDGRDPSGLKSR